MGKKVHSPYATPFLGMLFFIEAIFFLPVDPLLMLYCLEKPQKSLWYAAVATICSVLGGITAYTIGLFLWNTVGPQILQTKIVSSIISEQTFSYLSQLYNQYAHWAILVAGFSPIPYKAATLSAGFCGVAFAPFVIFSALSRGARFFLVAAILKVCGGQIKQFIDRYFNLLVTLTLIVIGLAFWFIKR